MTGKHWSFEEDALLKKQYAFTDTSDLIKLIPDRTLSSIHHRANRLGLDYKSDDYHRRRFMEFVKINNKTNCWEWTGTKSLDNYGRFRYKMKNYHAHRWAYEFIGEKILEKDKLLHHLCHNPPCVNPKHLEMMTFIEHNREYVPWQYKLDKTSCANGHEYNIENTIIDKYGHRSCKLCPKIYQERRKKL